MGYELLGILRQYLVCVRECALSVPTLSPVFSILFLLEALAALAVLTSELSIRFWLSKGHAYSPLRPCTTATASFSIIHSPTPTVSAPPTPPAVPSRPLASRIAPATAASSLTIVPSDAKVVSAPGFPQRLDGSAAPTEGAGSPHETTWPFVPPQMDPGCASRRQQVELAAEETRRAGTARQRSCWRPIFSRFFYTQQQHILYSTRVTAVGKKRICRG